MSDTPCIYVLAGTNGAGKSSIGGQAMRAADADYFNPDEAAADIAAANPGLPAREVNSLAWQHGKRLLEKAIAERLSFSFETTLGGATMTRLLEQALETGLEVRVWYVGLASPELHIARVRARVAAGGHDIPEPAIRQRYDQSRLNLIRLLPRLTQLRVYDNSAEYADKNQVTPPPILLLHMLHGQVLATCDLRQAPEWVKPILAAALK